MSRLSGLAILGGLVAAAIEAWPWSLALAVVVLAWWRLKRPPTG